MYKLNEDKFFYDVSENLGILIDFTTGIYYSLNTIGTAIFNRIKNGTDVEEIKKALLSIDGCSADINDKIDSFINNLLNKEALCKTDNEVVACKKFEDVEIKDGFEPIADEFSEVQDLIMADPVHDVNEEKG